MTATETMNRGTKCIEAFRAGRDLTPIIGTVPAIHVGSALRQLARRRKLGISLDNLASIIDEELAAYKTERDARGAEAREFEALREAIRSALPPLPPGPAPVKYIETGRTKLTRAMGRAMALDVGFDPYVQGQREIVHTKPDPADQARYAAEWSAHAKLAEERCTQVYRAALAQFGRTPRSDGDMTDYDLTERILARVA